MGFKEEIEEMLKAKKIRKKMPDKVDIRAYRMLVHSLQWISVGYSSALYFAGKKVGKEILADSVKNSDDIEKIIESIGKVFSKLGLGNLEVREIKERNIIVRIYDSASSYNMKPVGKPVCFFESGILAGILEQKLKKRIVVNETLCGGVGDEVDEFNIKIG